MTHAAIPAPGLGRVVVRGIAPAERRRAEAVFVFGVSAETSGCVVGPSWVRGRGRWAGRNGSGGCSSAPRQGLVVLAQHVLVVAPAKPASDGVQKSA